MVVLLPKTMYFWSWKPGTQLREELICMITVGDKSVFMIVIDRIEFLGDGLIPAHTVFWVNENTSFFSCLIRKFQTFPTL